MNRRQSWLILFAACLLLLSQDLHAQFGTELYANDFNTSLEGWSPLGLNGSDGSIAVSDGALQVNLTEGDLYGAYYASQEFSGHFEVVVDINRDHGVALALIKSQNGEPSTDDYSMLTVMRNGEGHPVVALKDRQGSIADVFDNTQRADRSRYQQTLSGEVYSIPFTQTAGKLRILRHDGEKFLHFYYAVDREIAGEVYQDWIELAQSKEWGIPDIPYFIGLFSMDGTIAFDNVKVMEMPRNDQSDVNTGFQVVNRPYTWSGYTDDALVISFDDRFPFAGEDKKFVFWELANNIPVWHLNDKSLFTHGFVETWGGGNPGCHEPMSDRLLGYSDLEVMEDNDIRKVIKWSYTLINPDYKVPTDGQGTQEPEAVEYFYIYADGSIIRRIQYIPKLDTDFRNWNEIMELILIAGQNNRPGDLLEYPSLTFHDLGQNPQFFNNEVETTYRNNNSRLGAVAMTAHIEDAPDIFNAFSDNTQVPETYSFYPLNYEVTWHDRSHNFGHWPINKEPYSLPCKSWSEWPQQVAHTSLVGMGLDRGQDWGSNFSERNDGRRFREWVSLLGMNEEDGSVTSEDKTNSWLFPGTPELLNDSATFLGYNGTEKYFEFETSSDHPACYFNTTPKTKLINPIVRVNQWGTSPVHVNVDGRPLSDDDYTAVVNEEGELWLLIIGQYSRETKVEISSAAIAGSVVLQVIQDTTTLLYPNPSDLGVVNVEVEGVSSAIVRIVSLSGAELRKHMLRPGSTQVDVSGLPAGQYILKIESGNQLINKKLIIK